jgi:tRNA (guanine-N7-)-methyltransferase
MTAGTVEYEHGVPIPGQILAPAQWVKTAIKRLPEIGPLDWAAIFGRTAPVVLDLGCGNGRFTLASAIARPEVDHLASDVLPAVIRYATRRANQRGLANTRFAVKDAQTFLRQYVAPASVAEIHLYHPQPYHDTRKRHLRVLTPALLANGHRALVAGGLFVIQTDNPDYWAYITRVIPHFFEFQPHAGPWPDAPTGRTRREILARQRGLEIFRGTGTPRGGLSGEAIAHLVDTLPLPKFRSRGPWSDLDRIESQQESE